MLIKPYITHNKKGKFLPSLAVCVNSLPSNTSYSFTEHPAYFGTYEEKQESLEIEGRLLMLPIMYKEFTLKANKIIHDNDCRVSWSICECQFAKKIRIEDLR